MPDYPLHDFSAEGFAPYGEAFAPTKVATRIDHVAALQNRRTAARPNLFLAPSSIVTLPHAFARMEAHPHSSQSFLPFETTPIVVGVALPGPDERPDLTTFKAFVNHGMGFSYHAGVWHLPVSSVGRPVTVAGFMYEDGSPEDCVWADVPPATLVDLQSLARST